MEEQRYYLFRIGMKGFRLIHDQEKGIIYEGPIRKQRVEYRIELDEITDPEDIEEIFKGN